MGKSKSNDNLRKDGKPKATAAQISAARRKAAEVRWAGLERVAWRTIRVHVETYERLDAMRGGRLTWDALFNRLALKRRR